MRVIPDKPARIAPDRKWFGKRLFLIIRKCEND